MAGNTNASGERDKNYLRTAIDLVLKVGILILLIYLCYKILSPFIPILEWGMIIAVILFPVFKKLSGWLGKRYKLSSILIMVVALVLLALPSIWLVNQIVYGISFLSEAIQNQEFNIPVPGESVADWPLIGPWVYDNWMNLSQNLQKTLVQYMPQISTWGERILSSLANTGAGILAFAASIIIAGFFLIYFEKSAESGKKFFRKIAGDRGDEFLDISVMTMRNVAAGVLGVAIIQTTLLGIGMILAKIPLAGLWILVVLIITIAQIPTLVFTIPLVIYMFISKDPLPAALWSVYMLVMGFLDNILKPVFMGKGSSVPMLVIFLGALGGFIAYGFIGLFLGAMLLSLAYKLYQTWVSPEERSLDKA